MFDIDIDFIALEPSGCKLSNNSFFISCLAHFDYYSAASILRKPRRATDQFCFSVFCFSLFNFLLFDFTSFGFCFLVFNFLVSHLINFGFCF